MDAKELILSGKTSLGIEFGSTRIKGVLIGPDHRPIASGAYDWENQLVDGVWTYSMDMIHAGLRGCYKSLKDDVMAQYGVKLEKIGAVGISAMMHGYLAFDANMNLLVPFRTWRNTMTGPAAAELTELFNFNIPQRWSIAHLYQAILNGEEHLPKIAFFTTLAGYVHWLLTGKKVLGVGDASGMMPIDSTTGLFDAGMIEKFDAKIAPKALGWKLEDILPEVLSAGDPAGELTAAGAKFLDPDGDLAAGIPFCPPEGDAGTGMAATNSCAVRTGNVSAGTSVFGMVVLEKAMSKVHTEIDMVTTPTGMPVAMVHCNTCTSDLNAWAGLFADFAKACGFTISTNDLYTLLFKKALEGDKDGGGLVAFNYFAGEPITDVADGRPLLTRLPDAKMSLANLMRTNLYASLATLKLGMDILLGEEHVTIDSIVGHGGLFKTKAVGQKMLAAAINAPVTVMETAGEGGPWGAALLADFMANRAEGETFDDYLANKVFSSMSAETEAPDPEDVAGFAKYIERYVACIPAEKAAVAGLN